MSEEGDLIYIDKFMGLETFNSIWAKGIAAFECVNFDLAKPSIVSELQGFVVTHVDKMPKRWHDHLPT